MSTKPTIIIVPGAWHRPEVFSTVAKILRSYGYEVICISLPSNGGDPPLKSLDEDVTVIRTAVRGVVDKGGEVVLVMHSYGSVPGIESLRGLGKAERATKRQQGGVIRLVYIAGFILREGESLLSALNGKPLPWFIIKDDYLYPDNPQKTFYNDLPITEQEHWTSKLTHQSSALLACSVTYAAWRYIPSIYIVCENDQGVPAFAQRFMIESVGKEGTFEVETCAAGHSPFLSQPDFVADVLTKAAGSLPQPRL